MFAAFVAAGDALADAHLTYETAAEYPLERIIAPGATPKSLFHVERMKLTKDKTAVVVNASLTLAASRRRSSTIASATAPRSIG